MPMLGSARTATWSPIAEPLKHRPLLVDLATFALSEERLPQLNGRSREDMPAYLTKSRSSRPSPKDSMRVAGTSRSVWVTRSVRNSSCFGQALKTMR